MKHSYSKWRLNISALYDTCLEEHILNNIFPSSELQLAFLFASVLTFTFQGILKVIERFTIKRCRNLSEVSEINRLLIF